MISRHSLRSATSASLVAVASALLVTSVSAHAAESTDSNVANAEDAGSSDIVVTARKRGESIVDVPVAVSALDSEALGSRNITDLNSLNGNVPGFRYQNSSANRNDRGFVNLTIRGMSVPVTVFVDGVPIPSGSLPGLNNLERIEVVNGPQSAYFGRATFAGAVNFVTKQPSLTDFGGSVNLLYTSRNRAEANVAVEGPIITDRLAVRLTGRIFEKDGEYKNFAGVGRLGDESTRALSAQIVARPTDTLKIRAYYAAWKDSDGASAQATLTESDYNCFAGGTARRINGLNYICGEISSIPLNRMSQNTMPPVEALKLSDTQIVIQKGLIDHLGLERRAYQANVLADWEVGGYTLSAALGKSHNEWVSLTDTYGRGNDGTGYSSTVLAPNDDNSESAELRLTSPKMGGFSFVLGGNYMRQSTMNGTRAYRPGTNGVYSIAELARPTLTWSRTYGIFGAINYQPVEQFDISLEGRYQWDTIGQDIDYTNLHQRATFRSFTPRVIANFHASDDVNLYVSYSEGRRPGVFNGSLSALSANALEQVLAQFPVPIAVPEEKLTNWEAGIKGRFFDDKLTILSAAYYGKWRGRQMQQNIPYTVGATTQTITVRLPNGSTNIWGLELQATARPTPELTIDGTFNWAATDNLFTSCSECVAINGQINPVGSTLERYPQISGSVNVRYERNLTGDWDGFVNGQWLHTGKMYDTTANVAWTAPSNTFHTSIGARNGTYSVEIFVRNLFDSKVPTNILRYANPNSAATQGVNMIILAPPERRSIGVRLGLTF